MKRLVIAFLLLTAVLRAQQPVNATVKEFQLTAENAVAMTPHNAPDQERWSDVPGNHYTQAFVRAFRYGTEGKDTPHVLVRVEPRDKTFAGRLEARNLKPNFCYQVKLRGDFARDPEGFRLIGGLGRWRLPGNGTNFTDADFDAYPDKRKVEAYVLFDYFVTDRHGNAVLDFALDTTLHVIWRHHRHPLPPDPNRTRLRRFIEVHTDDPAVYVRPKRAPIREMLWAETETERLLALRGRVELPPRAYHGELALTEESLHCYERDGGWWATVYTLPVRFEVIP